MNFTMAAGLICLCLGIWAVYVAFGAREKRVALLRNCVRVRGRVARLEDASTEGDTLTSWAAIVAYTAQDGRTYEYRMDPHFDRKKVRIGTKVPIFYERGAPGNATAEPRMWGVNVACALSFVPVLLGLGFLFTAYQDFVAAARQGYW